MFHSRGVRRPAAPAKQGPSLSSLYAVACAVVGALVLGTGVALPYAFAKKHLRESLEAGLREIERDCEPQSFELHSNMALVATVGKGMIRSLGVAARLFNSLYEAGVNVRMIDQGSSEMNIIVGVENDDLPTAVRAIYRAFA